MIIYLVCHLNYNLKNDWDDTLALSDIAKVAINSLSLVMMNHNVYNYIFVLWESRFLKLVHLLFSATLLQQKYVVQHGFH